MFIRKKRYNEDEAKFPNPKPKSRQHIKLPKAKDSTAYYFKIVKHKTPTYKHIQKGETRPFPSAVMQW